MTWDEIMILMAVTGFIGFAIGWFKGYGGGYKEGHIDRIKMIRKVQDA